MNDTTVDPAKDFRYEAPDGIVIEAYQITPKTRWRDQEWPPWLKKQRLDTDTNCVFTMADKPDDLWLALAGGDIEIPYLAWVAKRGDGSYYTIEAIEMEEYTKVVPLPPPVFHPPADATPGVVVELPTKAAQEHLTNIAADTTEMRGEMMGAIKLLQEVDPEDMPAPAASALEFLKRSMAARTRWCDCSPGQCEGGPDGTQPDIGSCRQHSPLVS